MNYYDCLVKLKDSTVKYVCFKGYNKLWQTPNPSISILTSDLESVVRITNANKRLGFSSKKQPNYEVRLDAGFLYLDIYEKGKGVFPEQFETQLINSRVLYETTIHKPDAESEFWAAIYMAVIHEGLLTPEHRGPVIEKLKTFMGISVCKYPNIITYTGVIALLRETSQPEPLVPQPQQPAAQSA